MAVKSFKTGELLPTNLGRLKCFQFKEWIFFKLLDRTSIYAFNTYTLFFILLILLPTARATIKQIEGGKSIISHSLQYTFHMF